MRGVRVGFRAAATTQQANVQSKPQQLAQNDYKELFMELWTAVQGLVDAVSTLGEDMEWAKTREEELYPNDSPDAMAKDFALYRARRRITYDILHQFEEVSSKLRKDKIPHNNTVDRRGMRE